MMSLANIEIPPLLCASAPVRAPARSGGALRGDLERIAMGIHYVENAAGLQRIGPIHPRVPARAAILHAGKSLPRVGPLLEARRHASVDRRHLLGAVPRAIG